MTDGSKKLLVGINPAGGKVSVEIIFPYACVGVYRVWLYDHHAKNPVKLCDGASDDDIPDIVEVDNFPEDLVGRMLFVRATAASMLGEPDAVGVEVRFRQDGQQRSDPNWHRRAVVGPGQEAVFNMAFRFQRE